MGAADHKHLGIGKVLLPLYVVVSGNSTQFYTFLTGPSNSELTNGKIVKYTALLPLNNTHEWDLQSKKSYVSEEAVLVKGVAHDFS